MWGQPAALLGTWENQRQQLPGQRWSSPCLPREESWQRGLGLWNCVVSALCALSALKLDLSSV